MKLPLLIGATMLAVLPVQAGIYRCVSAAGKVSYQDHACAAGHAASRDVYAEAAGNYERDPNAPTAADNYRAMNRFHAQERAQADAERAQARADQQRHFASEDARARQHALQNAARSARIDANSLVQSKGFQPRGSGLLRQHRAMDLEGQAAGAPPMPALKIPEPVFVPQASRSDRGPRTIFDQNGNPYTDRGSHVITDQISGRQCVRSGSEIVECY